MTKADAEKILDATVPLMLAIGEVLDKERSRELERADSELKRLRREVAARVLATTSK